MINRLPKIPGTSRDRPTTARHHVATVLAQEILDSVATEAFPIESEHLLCRRFNVSRVTVRLALSDLENRGLIYRRQGKGTFAHGRSTRIHRHIGVLIKLPLTAKNRPLAEFLQGVQTVMAPLRATLILIGVSPEEWSPELAGILAGVIVVAENVTAIELDHLRNRKLPFFIIGKTDLPGPHILWDHDAEANLNDPTISKVGSHLFRAGERAAEALSRAFLTGDPIGDLNLQTAHGHDPTFDLIANPAHGAMRGTR
jgi:DNA-binding transcriptional regulator YhcF (GntR family)